ncbi:MAG: FeoB-associated Cys-rich membrane protein [Sphaerochaetaceae bacterium]|jgi:hypothetical protein
MASIIVALLIFGFLGRIVFKMVKSTKESGSFCSAGCGSCPLACEEKTFNHS